MYGQPGRLYVLLYRSTSHAGGRAQRTLGFTPFPMAISEQAKHIRLDSAPPDCHLCRAGVEPPMRRCGRRSHRMGRLEDKRCQCCELPPLEQAMPLEHRLIFSYQVRDGDILMTRVVAARPRWHGSTCEDRRASTAAQRSPLSGARRACNVSGICRIGASQQAGSRTDGAAFSWAIRADHQATRRGRPVHRDPKRSNAPSSAACIQSCYRATGVRQYTSGH